MSQEENTKFDVTVIMTALDEEENIINAISDTLKAFDDFSINGEIVVINDGSTDKTESLVDEAIRKNDRIRMIKHDKPHGVGASFWDGVDKACGNIVVWLPGDNENDPWEILRYYKILEHVDMVIPFIFNKKARLAFRNILSYVYRTIINTTFAVNFNYTNGTILYRKSVLKDLDHRSKSFFFQTDILVRLAKRGYLFAEVPYRLGLRAYGVSKAVTFPSLMQVIRGYLRLVKDYTFDKKKNAKTGFPKDSLTAQRRQGE